MPNRFWIPGSLLLVLLALVVTSPGAAGAHSELIRSDPAAGEVLLEPPEEIRLWFVDAVDPAFSTVRLTSDKGFSYTANEVRSDGLGSSLVAVSLPDMPEATYALRWRTLSAIDGHSLSGEIAFGIGAGSNPRATGGTPEPFPVSEVWLRWAYFSAVAVLLGSLAAYAVVLQPGRSTGGAVGSRALAGASRAVLRYSTIAGTAALVLGAGLLVSQATDATGQSLMRMIETGQLWRFATETRFGLLSCVRELLVLLLVASVPLARRRPAITLPLIVPLAMAFAAVHAMAGHAASVHDDGTIAVAVDAAHLLAACVWAGGLFALVASIVFGPRGEMRVAVATWRNFAPLAGISFGVLAATGLYTAGQQVWSWDTLESTVYGQTLVAKSLLVALVAVLGLVNFVRFSRWPRPFAAPFQMFGGPRSLRATLLAELGAVVVVLLAVGILTSVAPARAGNATARQDTLFVSAVEEADDLLVRVSGSPDDPGTLAISVTNTRRPAPGPITGLQVLSRRATSGQSTLVTTRRVSEGEYRASIAADAADLTVSVQREGPPPAVAQIALIDRSPNPVSQLEAPLTIASLLAAAVATFALAYGLFFRKRLTRGPRSPLQETRDGALREAPS